MKLSIFLKTLACLQMITTSVNAGLITSKEKTVDSLDPLKNT